MPKLRIELVFALWGVMGCSGGITERNVEEGAAGDAASTGGTGTVVGEGGRAGAGTPVAGSGGALTAGAAGTAGGSDGMPAACADDANPTPVRPLSSWE